MLVLGFTVVMVNYLFKIFFGSHASADKYFCLAACYPCGDQLFLLGQYARHLLYSG